MNKITKSMTIGLTSDGQAGISISPDLTATEAYQLIGTLALHILNAYYKVAETNLTVNFNSGSTPKEQKLSSSSELKAATLGIKESMYDAMDSVFSNVLTQFYPEAPKSSLEDEAILQLTNELIEKRYNELTPEEREAFKKHYQATLMKLQESSLAHKEGSGNTTDENNHN